MSRSLTAVVTTIQPPTPCMRALASRLRSVGAPLIVVGDKKGPERYALDGTELLSLADQLDLRFKLPKLLPTGHYARKNIGYLFAIARGAAPIYETDDDNSPNDHWHVRGLRVTAHQASAPRWLNVYRYYTDEAIWPRGFPLDQLRKSNGSHPTDLPRVTQDAPIQQGLADASPDVDAIWRMVMDRDIHFCRNGSVALPQGTWCPFNSQSTWWWPPAYPLMYLPSYCTFRMTDIWRSFVAQRCLWAMRANLVFHSAEVDQERNEHCLLRDFKHEIPGYLQNDEIATALENLRLEQSSDSARMNLLTCYRALVTVGFLPPDELPLVQAWLDDLEQIASSANDRQLTTIS